jgi:L-iditol 2-dehydrogenase
MKEQSMKSAVLHGMNDIRWEETPMPQAGPGEVLIRVKASGICGSDLPRVLDKGAHFYPIVLGHEFAGEVGAIGPGVTQIKTGDRVVAAPLLPCHHCQDCLQGNYSLCRNYNFIGSRISGAWAEYVKVPEANCIPLPEGLPYEAGALFEPATVGLHGLLLMNFQGGLDIAVIGMGTIGLLTMQSAKLLGVKRVFAFDIDPQRLEIAGTYGADFCYNTGDPDFKKQVQSDLGRDGFPLVAETAGVEFTEKLCLELAANRGKVMYIGTPTRSLLLSPEECEQLNRKELTVMGSWMSYSGPFPGREWELAGYYFSERKIQYEKLIDRRMPMARIAEAFSDLAVSGKVRGKIILEGV